MARMVLRRRTGSRLAILSWWLLWPMAGCQSLVLDGAADDASRAALCERVPLPQAPPPGPVCRDRSPFSGAPQVLERMDCDAEVPEGPTQTTFPRNVIVLLGDGVGPRHWDAARIVHGGPLAVDGLDGPVLYNTGPSNPSLVTDSAAAATALATGRCTENGALSVSPSGRVLPTVLELAQGAGKRTGLITNTVMLDASPMAFATHVFDRGCREAIAQGLLDTRPDVVFGGAVPARAFRDSRSLAERAVAAGYQVVDTREQLSAWASDPVLPVLGAFGVAPSVSSWPDWEWGLTPEVLRAPEGDEPTLSEMTEAALEALGAGEQGFLLFVEDEHPDTVGHAAIEDQALAAELMGPLVLELDRAVQVAVRWVQERSSFSETLLLVCADHENGRFTFEGDTLADVRAGRFPASPFHTDTPVAAFARGPGSEALSRVEHISDLFHLMTGHVRQLPTAPGCDP